MGGAPRIGITMAFIRNLKARPKRIPTARLAIQLFGRT